MPSTRADENAATVCVGFFRQIGPAIKSTIVESSPLFDVGDVARDEQRPPRGDEGDETQVQENFVVVSG